MVCVPHRPTRMWLALSIYPSLFWTMVMATTTTRLISHWMSSSKWIAWTSIGPFPSLTTRVTHTLHSSCGHIMDNNNHESRAIFPWNFRCSMEHCNNNISLPGLLLLSNLFVFMWIYHSIKLPCGQWPVSLSTTVSQAGLGATDRPPFLVAALHCCRLLLCEIGCTPVCLPYIENHNIAALEYTRHEYCRHSVQEELSGGGWLLLWLLWRTDSEGIFGWARVWYIWSSCVCMCH